MLNLQQSSWRALAAATGFALAFGPLAGHAGDIAPSDADMFVQHEVIGHTLAAIGGVIGDDPGAPIAWTGTVTSTGWTAAIAAPYRDGVLTISDVGAYDSATDIASWTGQAIFSNAVATISFDNSGTYADATVDGGWFETFLVSALGVIRRIISYAETQTQALTAGGPVAGGVALAVSVGVAIYQEVTTPPSPPDTPSQEDTYKPDNSGSHGFFDYYKLKRARLRAAQAPIVPSLPAPSVSPLEVTGSGYLEGPYTGAPVVDGGALTVTAVPEPATWTQLLFGVGVIGALARRRRAGLAL